MARTKATNADRAAEIVARLTELVTSSGRLPWAKPWADIELATPRSGVTGRTYNGANRWMLGAVGELAAPDQPNVWVTYKQAQAEGGNVRRGEKSTPAVLWKFLQAENSDGEPGRTVPLLRSFAVFHWTQCDWSDGEPLVVRQARERVTTRHDWDPIERADEIAARYLEAGGPTLVHGGDRACYTPAADTVRLPHRHQFATPEGYHRTAFHELGHSTGHKSRLGREFGKGFGSELYSREELVAEMAAAILCGHAGIDSDAELNQSAGYLQSWLTALAHDPMALTWAAGRAEKAAAHVLGTDSDENSDD